MLSYIWGLYTRPVNTWNRIAELDESSLKRCLPYVIILAMLPPLAFVYGVTQTGWQITRGGDLFLMTVDSALQIGVLYYVGLVAAVVLVGYMIHWMATTYGARAIFSKGVMIAAFSATPLFILGLVAAYPVIWIAMVAVTFAAAHTTYLLYLGIPRVLRIDEDRGFMYASAIVAAGLVAVVATMGATVILWDLFAMPDFQRIPL